MGQKTNWLVAMGLVAGAWLSTGISAQEGEIDTSFGEGGKVQINMTRASSGDSFATAMVLRPDGKLLLAGNAPWNTSGDTDIGIVRLLPDGSLDSDFALAGKMWVAHDTATNAEEEATAIALKGNGQFIVSGISDEGSAVSGVHSVHRPDGFLDTAIWGDGTESGFEVPLDILVTDSGSVLSAGYSMASESVNRPRLFIIRADGSNFSIVLALDESAEWHAITRDSQGRYVTVGRIGDACLAGRFLLSPGEVMSLDTSFGDQGTVVIDDPNGYRCKAIWVGENADGRIVAATAVDPGSVTDFGTFRLTGSGTLDSTYGDGGYSHIPCPIGDACLPSDAVLDAEGRLLIGGSVIFAQKYFAARLLTDGTLDFTFGFQGIAAHFFGFDSSDQAFAIALRPNGRILLAGAVRNSASTDLEFGVMQLKGYVGLVFADDFEDGTSERWSLTTP